MISDLVKVLTGRSAKQAEHKNKITCFGSCSKKKKSLIERVWTDEVLIEYID